MTTALRAKNPEFRSQNNKSAEPVQPKDLDPA